MAAERLQKILAHAGVASRRAAETLIAEGRVRVNGRIVEELGVRADAHRDRIEVDGKRIVAEKPAYYLLHKPREMVTTLSDPEGRPALGDLLKRIPERVYPVGRLDYHTSGALLVTNDGELADALLSPRRKVPKVYAAKLKGHLDVPELDRLRNGVKLDDGYVTQKAEVFVLREEDRNTWVQITLTEGKNRQIHRMAQAIGHPVQRLVRMSFAGLDTEGLRPGEHRPLTRTELDKLKKQFLGPARRAKVNAPIDGPAEGDEEVVSARPTRRRTSTARPSSASGGRRGPRRETGGMR
jgi:23S rRNA pseudouridine2605 synthase